VTGVQVTQVDSGQLSEFIRFPWVVYREDPNWVPHLIVERKEFLSPRKNPFFRHADVAFFLCRRDGRIVGRIAAIINHLHNRFHEEKTGFFGLFECLNDADAASALFNTVARYLKERGMIVMRGPANMSSNDEWGLLVEGFDQPPQIMMTYNPRYYIDLVEANGFTKAKDLLAYEMGVPRTIPERLTRGVNLILKRNEFTIRKLNMKRFNEEVQAVKRVYNAAWEKNWGFVPMTDEEFDYLGKQMKPVVDPDLMFFAEHKGEPVGFCLSVPNIHEALIKVRDGRLFPTGLFKILWNTRKGKMKSLRVITLGVTREHRNSGIDAVFYYHCFVEGMRKGYRWGELSWILEDNTAMNRAIENLGGRVYKRYRIYDAPL
jgi:hypothetical protein